MWFDPPHSFHQLWGAFKQDSFYLTRFWHICGFWILGLLGPNISFFRKKSTYLNKMSPLHMWKYILQGPKSSSQDPGPLAKCRFHKTLKPICSWTLNKCSCPHFEIYSRRADIVLKLMFKTTNHWQLEIQFSIVVIYQTCLAFIGPPAGAGGLVCGRKVCIAHFPSKESTLLAPGMKEHGSYVFIYSYW